MLNAEYKKYIYKYTSMFRISHDGGNLPFEQTNKNIERH